MLQLPWPPSINHYWKPIVRRGQFQGMRVDQPGTLFRDRVRILTRNQLKGKAPELKGRLDVRVELCPPDERRRDLDNCLKALFDSLTHAGVWIDDSQIDVLTVRRGRKVADGLCAVTVSEFSGEIPA